MPCRFVRGSLERNLQIEHVLSTVIITEERTSFCLGSYERARRKPLIRYRRPKTSASDTCLILMNGMQKVVKSSLEDAGNSGVSGLVLCVLNWHTASNCRRVA